MFDFYRLLVLSWIGRIEFVVEVWLILFCSQNYLAHKTKQNKTNILLLVSIFITVGVDKLL